MIEDLLAAYNLKEEKRTGWELRNVEDPESVADHSWGTAFLCTLYSENENVDPAKAVRMAIIHDLAEAEIGDIPYRKSGEKRDSEEKSQLERIEIEKFSENFESEEMKDLWEEYEARDTKLARFVKDMDMIDLCLSALKYEKNNRYDPSEQNDNFGEYENMDEFFATTRERLSTEAGKQLFKEIELKYQEVRQR